jgi:hypothetical protein
LKACGATGCWVPEGAAGGLLVHLQGLEQALHHPGVRCNREQLELLLHPNFHEVGRSGTAYSRSTVIAHLLSEAAHGPAQPVVVSEGFVLDELAPGVALLTYRSANQLAPGQHERHSHRMSLWVLDAAPSGAASDAASDAANDTTNPAEPRWRLRYHQGTPAVVATC